MGWDGMGVGWGGVGWGGAGWGGVGWGGLGWMDGWREGGMEGWKDGEMEGWRDGWKDGWKEGRKDGWTDVSVCAVCVCVGACAFICGACLLTCLNTAAPLAAWVVLSATVTDTAIKGTQQPLTAVKVRGICNPSPGAI